MSLSPRRIPAVLVFLGACLASCGREPEGASSPPAPLSLPPEQGSLSPNAVRRGHDLLVQDAAARRDPADGQGRAVIEGSEVWRGLQVAAAAHERFAIVYEAGPAGVAIGGSVRVRPQRIGWSPLQTDAPNEPGYVEATTSASGVTLRTRITFPTTPEIDVLVQGRALQRGERVRIVLGAGSALTQVQEAAERGNRFWVLVDGDGDGTAGVLPDSPTFDVVAGDAARLVAFLPTTARPGETVRLGVAALDAHYNRASGTRGTVTLAGVPAGLVRRADGAPAFDETGSASVELVAEREGVYRITLQGPGGLQATSNPLVVSYGPRVLWGDLHGHSHLSDALGAPEDYFPYARDVSHLDVSVLTDHDHYGAPLYLDRHPEIWERIRALVRAHHAPGRFVTLLGFEWTSWLHGHRHVLYFEDAGEVLSSVDPRTENPRQLWDALEGQEALTFAHHSAGAPVATNWAYAPDPVLEPLTEIVSIHGSSESMDTPKPVSGMISTNTVQSALGRGYVLGFVGSGDTHDGHPGCPREPADGSCGLAAILSEDVSRTSVLEALRARRTYATNGPRILLRATLDGKPMGSTLPATGEHALALEIVGVKPLASVELIQNGEIIESVPTLSQREMRLERTLGPRKPGDYVYVRVLQLDQGAAWSSPFFFQ